MKRRSYHEDKEETHIRSTVGVGGRRHLRRRSDGSIHRRSRRLRSNHSHRRRLGSQGTRLRPHRERWHELELGVGIRNNSKLTTSNSVSKLKIGLRGGCRMGYLYTDAIHRVRTAPAQTAPHPNKSAINKTSSIGFPFGRRTMYLFRTQITQITRMFFLNTNLTNLTNLPSASERSFVRFVLLAFPSAAERCIYFEHR